MPDRFYNQGDPTQPARPPQQGKIVLGSFNKQPEARQRRPYQYQQPYAPASPQSPLSRDPNTLYRQPGQLSSYPNGRPRRRKGRLIGCLTFLILACVLASFVGYTGQRALAFGSAISTKAPLSTENGYMNTADRVNLLVMGFGGGTHEGANLTDSLVTISMIPQSHHTSLISVPRDLWVQYPPQSGQYTKMNSIYEFASNDGKERVKGADAAAAKIAQITGMDVKYWMMIDFNGFRELINSIGGIDVYVPDSFTAKYPKNDDPKVDPNWIQVKFKKGNTHMNGETAIRYARARYVLDNAAEGTDFARSARQQIIIKATLAKVKNMSTWPSLFKAMDALQRTIYTNMSLADLSQFSLKMDLNDAKTARIGLSNDNVLEDGTSNDGQYILQPKNNNWDAIPKYVQSKLYQ